MNTVKCLIVDDEPIAREIVEAHLQRVANWQLVGTCMNTDEAYEQLLNRQVEVIFLDIEMPGSTGVEFLKSLKNPPLVIFTTAYSEYALQSYELNVVDYLLKPIPFNRFYQSIEKANNILGVSTHDSESDKMKLSHMFVKQGGRLRRVNFEDIVYIKAEQEYSMVVLGQAKLLASKHLKVLMSELPSDQFTRIHRSYIVSHDKISFLMGGKVQMLDGTELPVGGKYKEELSRKLRIS